MTRKGTIMVMYDAPIEADSWMHGPHYDEVNATPGVTAVRRYEIIEAPAGTRKYIALIESDDVDATIAWRASPDGVDSQEAANSRGVNNRYAMVCRRIYSSAPGEAERERR